MDTRPADPLLVGFWRAARAFTERMEAEINRLRRALIAGRVDEAYFDREIAPMRRDLAEAQARLADAPPANVVTLHPAALAAMERVLTLLARHLPSLDPEEDRDMFAAFRFLIDRVTIYDRVGGGIDC